MSKLIFIPFLALFLFACKKERNQVNFTLNAPIPSIIDSKLDSILIDFDINATIKLYDIEIFVWDMSCQNCIVLPYTPLRISPSGNSHHFRGYVDVSSYPSGSSFKINIKSLVEPSNPATKSYEEYFIETIDFNI